MFPMILWAALVALFAAFSMLGSAPMLGRRRSEHARPPMALDADALDE
jgi:hypothetical protein